MVALRSSTAVAALGFLVAAASAASPTVLVTGATGRTGALLYQRLLEQGLTVRALVRNVTKARETLLCKTCDASEGIFVGDVTQSETLAAAMHGVTALAIATSASPICHGPTACSYPKGGYPVDVDFHGTQAQVRAFAQAGGRGPVVFCSSMGTTEPDSFLDRMGNGHIGFYKLNAEAFLMSSGLPFTVVKPCGLSNGPAGQAELMVGHDDDMHLKPPMVSRGDVARVMLVALLQPGVASGLRFDLCSRAGVPTKDIGKLFEEARYPWQRPGVPARAAAAQLTV